MRRSRDEGLVKRIKEIQKKVHNRYGSPRITHELARAGYHVGHNHVARLLREHHLGRRVRKRYRSTTKSDHTLPVAKNLLNREFQAPAANRAWCSDISYIATAEGWRYRCVVIDLYSRTVIGWAMNRRMKATLVVQALIMALLRRRWPRKVHLPLRSRLPVRKRSGPREAHSTRTAAKHEPKRGLLGQRSERIGFQHVENRALRASRLHDAR